MVFVGLKGVKQLTEVSKARPFGRLSWCVGHRQQVTQAT